MTTTHDIHVMFGDGIGPEVVRAAQRVVEATGTTVRWHSLEAGYGVLERTGTPLPPETVEQLRQVRTLLKGPMIAPKGTPPVVVRHGSETVFYPSSSLAVRSEMGIYAAVRPVRSFTGVPAVRSDVDLVVVREMTEDVYVGHEHRVGANAAEAAKIITVAASERVARLGCELARRQGRNHVTAVHKANVLKITDGLFLQTYRRVVTEYPDLNCDDLMIDAAAYHLVRNPSAFQVFVCPNQYGDILSDLAAGLAGSLGLAPGANYGEGRAMFEAAHGAAPDIAGRGIANPIAMILSAAMMLDYLKETEAATRIWQAVSEVLARGESSVLTPDLGGNGTTRTMTDAIVRILSS